MKGPLAIALGLLTAIGGFVDIGDLVTSGVVGSRFGLSLTWVMALGAVTTYLPAQHSLWQLLALIGVMGAINLPSTGSWALFGSSMRRHLQEPRFLRIFNTAAALALVASLYPLLTSP